MKLRKFFIFSIALLLTGCASTALPKRSDNHPANPDAPEAPLAPRSQTLVKKTHGSEGGKQGQEIKADSPSEGAAQTMPGQGPGIMISYVCPMHPEVIQGKPGECPKCGMELAPKAAAKEKGGDEYHPNH